MQHQIGNRFGRWLLGSSEIESHREGQSDEQAGGGESVDSKFEVIRLQRRCGGIGELPAGVVGRPSWLLTVAGMDGDMARFPQRSSEVAHQGAGPLPLGDQDIEQRSDPLRHRLVLGKSLDVSHGLRGLQGGVDRRMNELTLGFKSAKYGALGNACRSRDFSSGELGTLGEEQVHGGRNQRLAALIGCHRGGAAHKSQSSE